MGIIIFPNPNNGKFTIDLGENGSSYQLTVTNVFGQVVLSESRKDKNSSVIIDSPAGVYIFTVEISDGTKISQRVIKF